MLGHHRPLLRLWTSECFGLVNRADNLLSSVSKDIAASSPELFQRLDCVNHKFRVVHKPGSQPVIQAARRVLHLLRELLKSDLQRIESAGIITLIEEPSDWVRPLLAVRKKKNP